jgi:hypothetical protein
MSTIQGQDHSSVVDELDRDARVKLTKAVSGESVSGSTSWYAVEYTKAGAKAGFIHSSLVDCTR